jgi:hypothetical protein
MIGAAGRCSTYWMMLLVSSLCLFAAVYCHRAIRLLHQNIIIIIII